ncbi:MAG: murein biosynthesis integral membrane protein MurJ [Alphaproteobacteria bacterium]|nr:murein biosynthesis integral membrane protein MurJ [Alphaproteobacteria bacterium]
MSLFKSIATFGGFTLISRVTGFVRDMVLAYFMGASALADAFVVAFKLPNLFRSLFAEGAFTSAFVPLFSQKLVTEGKKRSVFFAAQAMMILAVIVGLLVVLFELLMPYVVAILAPGFHNDAGKIELAIELCRITFPFLLLISIVSFQGGILNSLEKFAAPAAAPIILNLTIIFSAFVFVPFMPTPAHGFALGITVAGVLEMLWLHIFLRRAGIVLHPYLHLSKIMRNPEIKTLFKRIAPGIVGAGIYQINMAVDTILVSLAGSGAISWLYYANRLQQLPLGVVGAAISVALLPVLSKFLKAKDTNNARTAQDKAVEYGLLLSFPAAVLLIVLAQPIVTFLFRHGQFTTADATQTAYAVIAYSVGLPCYVITKALMPNFFARGDTVTPVKYSFWVFVTNLSFNIILMQYFGHIGIAMATTIAAFVSLGQYICGLKRRGYWQFKKQLLVKMSKIIFAAIIMGCGVWWFLYAVQSYFPRYLTSNLYVFGVLACSGILALVIFITAAKILHIIDFRELLGAMRRKNV